MAGLDDFFAKKDLKKSKGLKFTTLNDIDKKIAETDRKRDIRLMKYEDTEWKDFEEKRKDYSGLKIQNTIISEQDYETNSDEDTICPWKTMSESEKNLPEVEESEKENRKEEVLKAVHPSTYVPPHLRKKKTFTELMPKEGKQQVKCSFKSKEAMFPRLSEMNCAESNSDEAQKKCEDKSYSLKMEQNI